MRNGNWLSAFLLPPLFEKSEEGFADCQFALVDHSSEPSGAMSFRARARFKFRPVGFEVSILPGWRLTDFDGDMKLWMGPMCYRSLGSESDRLVAALGRAFGKSVRGHMAPEVYFNAIALNGGPKLALEGKADIKLFFESDLEERYAEVYTNISVGQRLVEIREKDPDYREPLLRALSEGGA